MLAAYPLARPGTGNLEVTTTTTTTTTATGSAHRRWRLS
jgi:hypothetical protein